MSSQSESEDPRKSFDRRSFLKGAGGAAAGSMLTSRLAAGKTSASGKRVVPEVSGKLKVKLTVNGDEQEVEIEPRTTLLSALRDHCQPRLTGTKLVCDQASCGACTVLIDGEARNACMTLAIDVIGARIRTVEGLANGTELSPLQQSFCENDALMCGFCTPGFLMSLTGELEKNPGADIDQIRDACRGNLCRCGTYPFIFQAAQEAGARMRGTNDAEGGR